MDTRKCSLSRCVAVVGLDANIVGLADIRFIGHSVSHKFAADTAMHSVLETKNQVCVETTSRSIH